MSIKEQATKSVFWSAVERFSVQGIQFVLTIVIARILTPDDYGLVAMLGIFMALSQVLIDSGFAYALIQKKERSETDYSTAFHFNAIGSITVYGCLFFCAPFIATFFQEPQLLTITRVAGLNLIINSLGIIQQAKLTIDLDFKRQAQASLIAVLISGGVGVWMAYNGCGVWTLVWQGILNNLLRVSFLWIFSCWMPRWIFSIRSFRSLFSFGSKLMLSAMLHTLYTNCYSLIIGKVFSASELGYFNRSYTLAQFPSTNFTNIIIRAIYPIQCRYQDDILQLRSMFMKYMRISCFFIFPVMVGVAALAEPLIRLMLTDKWLPAVPFLRILCIAFMWDPIMKINHNMLNVKGRTDYFLYAELCKKVVAFGILFATIPFGVTVMCWGLVLYAFADMAIIIYFSKKIVDIGHWKQFCELLPIIILNIVIGAGMYLVTLLPISFWWQIILSVVFGGGGYLYIAYLFRMQEWNLLFSLVRRISMKCFAK